MMSRKYVKPVLQTIITLLLTTVFVVWAGEGHAMQKTLMTAVHWLHHG